MLAIDRVTTHTHDDRRKNRFLKRKRVNNLLSNLNKPPTKQVHPDMTMISEE